MTKSLTIKSSKKASTFKYDEGDKLTGDYRDKIAKTLVGSLLPEFKTEYTASGKTLQKLPYGKLKVYNTDKGTLTTSNMQVKLITSAVDVKNMTGFTEVITLDHYRKNTLRDKRDASGKGSYKLILSLSDYNKQKAQAKAKAQKAKAQAKKAKA